MKQQIQKETPNQDVPVAAAFQTGQDVKNAVLILSVFANLVLFVTWLTLQLTSQYDTAFATWLIGA